MRIASLSLARTFGPMLSWLLAVLLAGALLALLARLAPGRHRLPPVAPRPEGTEGSVSVILATLDEAERAGPCLEGLMRQGAPVREILVVDSHSTDGTAELVREAARRDPRVRLLLDPPLPDGWLGKAWAMEHGLRQATGEWVLTVDADTAAAPGMAAAALEAAREHRFDAVSFSPRFALSGALETLIHPALLVTLVYRGGSAGAAATDPERLMANGQCFLLHRDTLVEGGGFAPARRSFCDDVTLARHLARRGARVGFLDGRELYVVRPHASARAAWRDWGRSLDLKDAAGAARQWADVALLLLAQGAPLPVLLVAFATGAWRTGGGLALVIVAGTLLLLRLLVHAALRPCYVRGGVAFWLSPLLDWLGALRILLSTLRRPKRWRTRVYAETSAA